MEELLDFTAGMSLALLVLVLFSIRRQHIRVEYSVSWFGAALALLVLSRWPAALETLAGWLGIGNPPLALLLIIGMLFLLVIFRLSVIISDLKDANIALTQRVAILEYRLDNLHGEARTKA
ncbi:MAG: DUF2304 domain-containing protein [Bryobacterales bacterium]|nr:DUF2304 domain-containing protein [Bryobacteraceae bacterium]MDW8130051.1 DUF2304 domain-containing protein [Bryobacterales bacterium]